MRSLRIGRLIGYAVVFLVSGLYWVASSIGEALNFTKTDAVVERVENVCYLQGEPKSSARDCVAVVQRSSGSARIHHVYRTTVRYQSPADNREHKQVVYVEMKRAAPPESGRSHRILAHDRDPERIKWK